jgi:hypothetical protein
MHSCFIFYFKWNDKVISEVYKEDMNMDVHISLKTLCFKGIVKHYKVNTYTSHIQDQVKKCLFFQ